MSSSNATQRNGVDRKGSVAVVGISHHTAPLDVRERLGFSAAVADELVRTLVERGRIDETVLLATCNRTEVYLRAGDPAAAIHEAKQRMAEYAEMPEEALTPFVYRRDGRDAASHLFRVASSLDSMVVGEAQIQGQVKEAYARASAISEPRPAVGPVLGRLFETAFSVGGRVRSQTRIGAGAASVPSAAVELARKIFGSLRGRRALLLGAGEMSGLSLACLSSEGIGEAVVASRTMARARRLAESAGARAVPFERVEAELRSADIVVSATGAPHAVLTRSMIETACPDGRGEPLLIVDIAVPRDVEPEVGELDNIFLYDIDDLQQIVDGTLDRRHGEIDAAEAVVAEAADDYWAWFTSLDAVPLIRELRGRAEAVRRAEVERAMRKLQRLSPEEREAVEHLTHRLLNKVLHSPTVRLREAAADRAGVELMDAARYLFELETDETDQGTE